jgi:hypothetical protein
MFFSKSLYLQVVIKTMDRFLQEVSPRNDPAIQALEGIRLDPPPVSTVSEDIWWSWATMHMERIIRPFV